MTYLKKEQKELIKKWHGKKIALDKLKKEESILRDKLVDSIYPSLNEGTNTKQLSAKYAIVVTQHYLESLDEKKLLSLEAKLPTGLINKITKVKRSLIKKEYNALTQDQRDIIDDCLTREPGKPSVAIKELSK